MNTSVVFSFALKAALALGAQSAPDPNRPFTMPILFTFDHGINVPIAWCSFGTQEEEVRCETVGRDVIEKNRKEISRIIGPCHNFCFIPARMIYVSEKFKGRKVAWN